MESFVKTRDLTVNSYDGKMGNTHLATLKNFLSKLCGSENTHNPMSLRKKLLRYLRTTIDFAFDIFWTFSHFSAATLDAYFLAH